MANPSPVQSDPRFSDVESELIQLFVRLAQAFSLPKSIGEIFGLIFATPDPIPFEEIVDRLGISKGSASSGLKFLQRVNAVKTVYIPRDRRTFYTPELSMRNLVGGLLNETVMPHLRESTGALDRVHYLIEQERNNGGNHEALEIRLESLRTWQSKAQQILPVLNKFLGQKE